MKITKQQVDKIKPPIDKPQVFYRDDCVKGFALRVTQNGAKSFVVEKLINKKVKRITLGRYGEITAEQARKEAQKLLGKIATGIDPLAEKRTAILQAMTLDGVFEDYLKVRKELKPKTLYDYQRMMNAAFSDWKKKYFLSITKDKIAKHHAFLGEKHGKAYANSVMRLLRALFNFAAGQYEDSEGRSLVMENPVKRLSQTRAWYRIKPRQTYIKTHEFSAWYSGVQELENEVLKDYLLLLVLSGLRRNEAAKLKWPDIDLKNKTLSILDPKNHHAHTLPLSDYLHNLLVRRANNATNEYVFPGTGKSGHIIEPRKQMVKVIEASKVSFTVHDLRRTFITIAESLDISAYAVKRLVNHKMSNDVTAGYIVTDVERLRKPMQQITDFFVQSVS